METDIKKAKTELIQWIKTTKDESLIQQIMDLKKSRSKDWWEDIGESEKKSIQKGLSDANDAALKPHKEAKKIYEKWL